MLVELGNTKPVHADVGPTVTYITVPDSYSYVVADSAAALALETAAQIGRATDGITHMPDQEALLATVASWRAESAGTPTWVWSDNDDFAVLLGHFFDCPVGRPDAVEETHHTHSGPPGVGPGAAAPPDPTSSEENPR